MLTLNADGHVVYERFHKTGEEKRMLLILGESNYDRWLTCSVEEAKSDQGSNGDVQDLAVIARYRGPQRKLIIIYMAL